jgi:Flp pilus assembly pilin Flp
MFKRLMSLYRDEKGFTTIEWLVLGGIVAGMAVAGGMVIHNGITTAAGTINTNLNSVVSGAGNNNVTW